MSYERVLGRLVLNNFLIGDFFLKTDAPFNIINALSGPGTNLSLISGLVRPFQVTGTIETVTFLTEAINENALGKFRHKSQSYPVAPRPASSLARDML
ncbi:MAG: hypothetical protein Q9184_005931 [Pyrenodesmia sp. 2 TL-2023]